MTASRSCALQFSGLSFGQRRGPSLPEGEGGAEGAGGVLAMANERARELRKSMTRQEVKLWLRLRELRSIGHHFRRQSPLAPYIVDFECRRWRVIVEVDGHQHGLDEHQQRDKVRDQDLSARGYTILRFSNGEVERNMDGVLEVVRLALVTAAPPHPAPSAPPSPDGEG